MSEPGTAVTVPALADPGERIDVAETTACLDCGGPFARRSSRQKRCPKCQAAWRSKDRTGARCRIAICEVCDKAFRHEQTRHQRCCSRSCASTLTAAERGLHSASTPIRYGDCICGRTFISRQGRRFCSPSCVPTQHLVVGSPVSTTCRECGEVFTYPSATRPREFCSLDHRRAWSRRQPNYRAQRRAQKSRRRATLRAAEVERFTPDEIFERDRWRCMLCGKHTNRSASVPHPKAPTLDHVVPLSRGGAHTRANTQCAHFLCNSLKGDRTLNAEQLRLVRLTDGGGMAPAISTALDRC